MAEKSFLQQLVESGPPPADDTPYYAAIGRFIVSYAVAEAAVHRLARRLLGISDEKARVLFAGSRIGDVISRIRGVIPLIKISKKSVATIEDCLKQLDLIGDKRHKFVHRFVDLRGDSFHLSNFMTAKSSFAVERDSVSKVELEQMYNDCWLIFAKLDRTRNHNENRRNPPDKPIQKQWLKSAWRYTPAPQPTRKKPSPAALKIARLLSQPQSSRK